MKTKQTPAKGEVSADAGRVALLSQVSTSGTDCPERERGPGGVFVDEKWARDKVLQHSVALGSGSFGRVFALRIDNQYLHNKSRRLLVITPGTVDDHDLISANRGWDDITIKHLADARAQTTFVEANVRGAPLLVYLRRLVAAQRPYRVVIWPVEYLLGPKITVQKIVKEIGWQSEPVPVVRDAVYHDPYDDGHDDPDDPTRWGDWWKKGGK